MCIFYTDIKYQIHVCHVNLKQNHQAIVVLQSIPGKLRNAKINMALAKLYQQGGMERSAITSYKEVLRVWSYFEIILGDSLIWLLCSMPMALTQELFIFLITPKQCCSTLIHGCTFTVTHILFDIIHFLKILVILHFLLLYNNHCSKCLKHLNSYKPFYFGLI